MGAWGTRLHVARIAEGDIREAFHALRDDILDRLYELISVDTIAGLEAYLGSEDFHTWQSDRLDVNDEHALFFAFWDDDQLQTAEYARHCYDVVIANDLTALDRIARDFGFTILPAAHALAKAMNDRFVLAPMKEAGSQILEAAPWCRGQPIAGVPSLVHHATGTLSLVDSLSMQTRRALRAVAMTGRCLCPLCIKVRSQRRLPAINPSGKIASAWELLDHDPTGAALANDPASLAVLADWLEERGVTLVPELLEGLATSFRTAERYAEPIQVVLVLHEDTYETRIGDGYYAYLSAAFRDRSEAARWIDEQARDEQIAYHVREAVLEARRGHWQMSTDLGHHEHANLSDVLVALGLPARPPS